MDKALEASSKRIRYNLSGPIPGSGKLLNEDARNTVNEVVRAHPASLHRNRPSLDGRGAGTCGLPPLNESLF
ncbi:MAG: hypothetical protein JW395_3960 [Nitrospira sp.]|nr:hypothetical protein [Nitrospira sp.]